MYGCCFHHGCIGNNNSNNNDNDNKGVYHLTCCGKTVGVSSKNDCDIQLVMDNQLLLAKQIRHEHVCFLKSLVAFVVVAVVAVVVVGNSINTTNTTNSNNSNKSNKSNTSKKAVLFDKRVLF